MNSYGHFSDDGREFVITKPDTPRPWSNYLFNDNYHAIVTQTGGGFSYYRDPKYFRLLRYDHLTSDRPGRYLFIRDEKSGQVFSPGWQPLREKLDFYECRHGLGYTTITGEKFGLRASLRFVVPEEAPVELWLAEVTNTSNEPRELSLFPYVDWIVGDVSIDTQFRNIAILYNRAQYDPKRRCIRVTKLPYPGHKESPNAFLYSEVKPSSFETRREGFLGRYGSIERPDGLSEKQLRGGEVEGEDMVGVFQVPVLLQPGETAKQLFMVGTYETQAQLNGIIRKYGTYVSGSKAQEPVTRYWRKMTEELKVGTPDASFDRMVNVWGRLQLIGITHWRGTSLYHGTEGGLGYRDTAQDAEGLFALDLKLARKKMEKILYFQYNSGHAVSGFSDIEGPWDNQGDGMCTGKADVAVWLPYMVVSYLKETGDFKYLKKVIPFHDHGSATVYEHTLRSIRYIYSKRGAHGLPLIFKADWNDAYDAVGTKGKGESVWLGMALARACAQIGALARHLGDKKIAKEMDLKHATLTKIINAAGWDGKWYSAAFNDEGRVIGSHKQKEGRIPLNSQTWAILGEVVPRNRLPSILKCIDKDLWTKYGPVLFSPVYSKHQSGIGRVTSFARGTKENAAVFSHACAFKIVADCMLGRGNEAYDTYSRLMPTAEARAGHPERYMVEPYVFSEYVVGPGHPYRFGEGAFTWNTGTTPWMFVAAAEWILGARREYEGLLIDPCLPSHWKSASIRRPFRGRVYDISIENPDGVQKGVQRITVDGKPIEGTILPLGKQGGEYRVQVVMGKTPAASPAPVVRYTQRGHNLSF